MEVVHCGNTPFCFSNLDFDPMTFIYKPNPYLLEIYRMCENELPIYTSSLSKVIISQPASACIKLRLVTSGHVTKMTATPFDPP